jgi:hypothetical protein
VRLFAVFFRQLRLGKGEHGRKMASKIQELEKRISSLEQEMSELKAGLGGRHKVPWYRQILGQFKDDPAFDEIVRLGQRIREGERRRAR